MGKNWLKFPWKTKPVLCRKATNCYSDICLTAALQVVNLQHSEVQDRVMLTGRHMVRDVSCKNCNSKLGWMYEFATEESQRYKEGRVILERALVRESEGFEHVPSDNSWVHFCCLYNAQHVHNTAFPLAAVHVLAWTVCHLWVELHQNKIAGWVFVGSLNKKWWTFFPHYFKHLRISDPKGVAPLPV